MAQEQMNPTGGINIASRLTAAGRSGNAVVWGIVILVVIVAAAAWYFYAPLAAPAPAEDAATKQLETQSASDDVDAINQDLQQTELNNLDKESTDINAAF